jgi:hypothetical protein
MSGNSTVNVPLGSVTVTTAGSYAGYLLGQINSVFTDPASQSVSLPGAVPTVSGSGNSLNIFGTEGGAITLPSSGSPYDYIAYNGGDTIFGVVGNGSTSGVVAGDGLNFIGGAATVLGAGSAGGNIIDSVSGALISVADGDYNVTLTGSNDIVVSDHQINASVSGAQIYVGTGVGSSAIGTINDALGTDFVIAFGQTTYTGAAAASAPALVYDYAGGSLFNEGGNFVYDGLPQASVGGVTTIVGATGGNDVLYTYNNIIVDDHAGATGFLEAQGSSVSVAAAADETVYANAATGYYSVGGSTFSYIALAANASAPSHVTVQGQTSGTEYIATNNNTFVTVDGAAAGKGAFWLLGDSVGVNASTTAGGDYFSWTNNTGNATLVGSSAGNDTFLFATSGTTTAHTVQIENWQASDNLYFYNWSASGGSNATDQTAITNIENTGSGTFSDGTTVTFVGSHPTASQIHVQSW